MEVPCRQSVRGSKPSHSLSLTVAQRLSFGLIVEGKVVNMLSTDLNVARVNRMVLSLSGLLASAALVWLGWRAGRS
jgi:hypothetical protein